MSEALKPSVPPRLYHVILSTYGAWLYGDPRGFRTRHHREHIDGDYHNPPPPGTYARREQQSRASLKHAPLILNPSQREVVGTAIVTRLESMNIDLHAIAVCGQHVHVCIEAPDTRVREHIGVAKRHAWYALRESGYRGKLWAKRCSIVVIKDEQHLRNVHRYIMRHAQEGAWTHERPRVATRGH